MLIGDDPRKKTKTTEAAQRAPRRRARFSAVAKELERGAARQPRRLDAGAGRPRARGAADRRRVCDRQAPSASVPPTPARRRSKACWSCHAASAAATSSCRAPRPPKRPPIANAPAGLSDALKTLTRGALRAHREVRLEGRRGDGDGDARHEAAAIRTFAGDGVGPQLLAIGRRSAEEGVVLIRCRVRTVLECREINAIASRPLGVASGHVGRVGRSPSRSPDLFRSSPTARQLLIALIGLAAIFMVIRSFGSRNPGHHRMALPAIVKGSGWSRAVAVAPRRAAARARRPAVLHHLAWPIRAPR